MAIPATLREKSTWTPKSFRPSNQKIFEERMGLIQKWYAAWNEGQRWTLLEYLLRQQNDSQLLLIHDLLHPTMPPPDHDFTRVLPRFLTLKIFSLLDPQSLCRAAQVCWYWKFLSENNNIWRKKCLKLGWFLPSPSVSLDYSIWKRHYIACVCQLHWNPPKAPEEEEIEEIDIVDLDTQLEETTKKKKRSKPYQQHTSTKERRPWKDPDPIAQDTHFQHNTLHYSALGLRPLNQSRLQSSGQQTPTRGLTPSRGLTTTSHSSSHTTVDLLPPPDSLIHPVLLEKMRLNGSSSKKHTQLTTLNIDQSEQDIYEAFYDLHKTNPFPRLPPYYVHKSEHLENTNKTRAPTSRPPSGRERPDTSRKATVEEYIQSRPKSSPNPLLKHPKQANGTSNNGGLRSQPWTIPNDSDDEDET